MSISEPRTKKLFMGFFPVPSSTSPGAKRSSRINFVSLQVRGYACKRVIQLGEQEKLQMLYMSVFLPSQTTCGNLALSECISSLAGRLATSPGVPGASGSSSGAGEVGPWTWWNIHKIGLKPSESRSLA